jgi:2-polyprenyl-3-methyl-5-hydroxy-6-metoxy-1,4-benzoquinol methylase
MDQLNVTYQDHYKAALNPISGDLKLNLLRELKSYLKISTDEETVYKTCQQATQNILDNWQKQKINPTDATAVSSFYTNMDLYCYELIGLEIDAPVYRQEQLKQFVELLKNNKRLRGCDFGSGIGTLGIYLNQNGVQCDFADVSDINLDFISARLQQRNLKGVKTINLNREQLPAEHYEFITAFDVLEHVANPIEIIQEIHSKLRVDGLFIFNLIYHNEENTPHILGDPNPIRKSIRGFGFRKLTSIGEFKVYKKVDRPAFVNSTIRALDEVFWNFKTKVQTYKQALIKRPANST